jgi:DNA-binding NarL/FixJ family response regulator
MKSCLVLDDVPDAQAWLARAALASFPGIAVSAVANLAEARAWLAAHPMPDLALIDLGLPDGSGSDLIAEITNKSASTVCIVASIFDDNHHLIPALRAGAQGYLLKDQSWEVIAESLRGIVAGKPPLSPSIARKLLTQFRDAPTPTLNAAASDAPSAPPRPRLTDRETEVLRLIAKGLTMSEVARDLGISAHTVSGYVKEIYRKLNITSRAEAAISARDLGLV